MLTIDRAEMIEVVQRKKIITGETTTAGEAPKRSGKVQGLTEVEEAIGAETGETDPMGRTRLAELSSLDRFLCLHYRKQKLQRCGLESH